jgi:hypothetical protein
MVVFGGNDGAGGSPDSNLVWVLTLPDPTIATVPVWSQPAPAGPPTAREAHVAAYNPSTQKMAMFGGTDATSANSELWELDLAGTPTWNLISTSFSPPSSGPAARYFDSAIFVASGGKMLIFGGAINATPTFFDVWEVDF